MLKNVDFISIFDGLYSQQLNALNITNNSYTTRFVITEIDDIVQYDFI